VSVRRLLAVLAAVAFAIPASLTAQVKFQVVPFFTSYYAVGNIADKTIKNIDFSNPPDGIPDPVNIKEKQGNGPGLGVRARAWINPQFGFEGSFAYVWTGRQAKADPSTLFAASFVDGNAILLSGRVLYRPRRSNLHLLAGLGYMSLGGDAWDVKKFTPGTKLKTNNIFGVVGFGARASITPKLALDVGVEANIYKVDRVKTPAGSIDIFDSKSQSDILVSIGVPFGGR
jgi:hypothetical protein